MPRSPGIRVSCVPEAGVEATIPAMAELYPLRVLLASLAGFVNRHQAEVLEYLVEENRVLKEQLKGRKLRLTDDQRRRLAAKGHRLGRRVLAHIATIVTPDTILRWHRKLIAAKWTTATNRVGRPGLMMAIRALIVRFATENSTWGYCRIQGALKNLGHEVVDPARSPRPFEGARHQARARPADLLAHLPEAPTGASWRRPTSSPSRCGRQRGLRTYYVLFVMRLETRRVHIAGITRQPDRPLDGPRRRGSRLDFLRRRSGILDPRPGQRKFALRFRIVLEHAGVKLDQDPGPWPRTRTPTPSDGFAQSSPSASTG